MVNTLPFYQLQRFKVQSIDIIGLVETRSYNPLVGNCAWIEVEAQQKTYEVLFPLSRLQRMPQKEQLLKILISVCFQPEICFWKVSRKQGWLRYVLALPACGSAQTFWACQGGSTRYRLERRLQEEVVEPIERLALRSAFRVASQRVAECFPPSIDFQCLLSMPYVPTERRG